MEPSSNSEEIARDTVRCVRRLLANEADGQLLSDGRYQIDILSVTLETRDSKEVVVIRFREESRPECVFEFEMEATEPQEDEAIENDPETWASIIYSNLEERLSAVNLGLPNECDPEKINRL